MTHMNLVAGASSAVLWSVRSCDRLDGPTDISAYSASVSINSFSYVLASSGCRIQRNDALTTSTPSAFSSKYLDPETGFYYYGYRYYDPVTGRFISNDPIEEEGGDNLYETGGNACIGNYDKLGLYVVYYDVWPEAVPANDPLLAGLSGSPIEDVTTVGNSLNPHGPNIKAGLKAVDAMLKAIDGADDALFDAGVAAGVVKFNGKSFAGKKADYRKLVEREKKTQVFAVVRDGADANGLSKTLLDAFSASAKGITEDHDEMGVGIHGVLERDANGNLSRTDNVKVNGQLLDRQTTLSAATKAARPPNRHLILVSCYRTIAKDGAGLSSTTESYGIVQAKAVKMIAAGSAWQPSPTDPNTGKNVPACEFEFTPFKLRKMLGATYIEGDARYEP
ncbi:MAG: hypothetical protein C0404_14620 [Verrucomicrobia bacterium]|nr:hypothetical protein [Verrucomicrobiota bacterium]